VTNAASLSASHSYSNPYLASPTSSESPSSGGRSGDMKRVNSGNALDSRARRTRSSSDLAGECASEVSASVVSLSPSVHLRHRFPIVSSSGQLCGSISQLALVYYLCDLFHRQWHQLDFVASKTAKQLGWCDGNIRTVREDASVLSAISLLLFGPGSGARPRDAELKTSQTTKLSRPKLETGHPNAGESSIFPSALGVVDANGILVGNFSGMELKRIVLGQWPALMMPLGRFLRTYAPRSVHCVTFSSSATILQITQAMAATHLHRVWIVNEKFQPVGLVTTASILEAINGQLR